MFVTIAASPFACSLLHPKLNCTAEWKTGVQISYKIFICIVHGDERNTLDNKSHYNCFFVSGCCCPPERLERPKNLEKLVMVCGPDERHVALTNKLAREITMVVGAMGANAQIPQM